MPGAVRQFEPQITRSGGAASQYRFTTRCSGCPKTDTFEASRPVGDDQVRGYFRQRGWVLGRDRAYDLCPACLAKPQGAEPPRSFKDSRPGPAAPAKQPDPATRTAAPADRRHRDTADILSRHLGKSEVLAAEVFRPKETQAPRLSTPDSARQPLSAPALPPGMEQALTGMAADLKGLRSAIELMAEQVSKLVALGGQQIEAIVGLGPLVVQSAEGISSSLQEVVSAVRSIPKSLPLPHPAVPLAAEQQPTQQHEPIDDHDQAISAEPEPHTEVGSEKPLKQGRGSKRNEEETHKTAPAPVVVKSIPDAKRSDRFYTTIRLPRAIWDRAGLGPDDRLVLGWSGKTLRIERAAEGGVKPKSIGDAAVILQTWKLGNLNFDQPKAASADASLRLTVRPSRS